MADSARTSPRPEENAGRRSAIKSLLLIDCGSVFTTVGLTRVADGQSRLVARATCPTTATQPRADIMLGVLDAVGALEHIAGFPLVRDGQVISPEQPDGSGVDAIALVTSVGGPLRIYSTGPGRDTLAALLHRALAGLFTQVEQIPALEPPPYSDETLQAIANTQAAAPHAMLIIGGTLDAARSREALDGAALAVSRWQDALKTAPGGGIEQTSRDNGGLPVIFSGAPDDAAYLQAELRESAQIFHATQTLSPNTLTPLNRTVGSLYEGAVLRAIPGYERLRRAASAPPMATITSLGGAARFLAQRYAMNVALVDVGASSTLITAATKQGEFVPGAQPGMGVGPGAGRLLRAAGASSVLRWLPFDLDENGLREYILSRMLRPQSIPATAHEVEIEHALAREAIRLALQAPGSRLMGVRPLDIIVATGGVFTHAPTPAHIALMLLDTLPLHGITSLALDSAGIISTMGMAGALAPELAAHVVEVDALTLPLGPVITTSGSAPDGEVAVFATLELADGRKYSIEAPEDSLVRLPLAQGERALLDLKPHPMVDIGLGQGHSAKATESIEGGALGVIIDTRRRPLALATDGTTRIARLRAWRDALQLGTGA
ncbi:MAG TPA: glutamate mutase L [Ktedonobacterales bacterium]